MTTFFPQVPGLRGSRSERLEIPPTAEILSAPVVQNAPIGFSVLGDGIIVNVDVVPTPILPPSPTRKYLFVQNNSVNDIWIGGSARVNVATSLKVEAGGGTHEFNDSNMLKGELWAIATLASALTVVEGN